MIKVEIKDSEIISLPADSIEAFLIGRFKEAGIPVIGFIKFGGVASGVLHQTTEFSRGVTKFEWIGAR